MIVGLGDDMDAQDQIDRLLDTLAAVCEEAGYAMIAAVELSNGTVEYRNTYLKQRPADQLEEIVTLKLKSRHL